jgi:hypothetical protein
MDGITLIVTALAAGAALGIRDTASSAVNDAYTGLKALVRERLRGRPYEEMVLTPQHEEAPETWQVRLTAVLDQAGAGDDPVLVGAAEVLMRLVDEAGARAGKYAVDVRGAQGVQVGDGNTQHNAFGVLPGGLGPADAGPAPGAGAVVTRDLDPGAGAASGEGGSRRVDASRAVGVQVGDNTTQIIHNYGSPAGTGGAGGRRRPDKSTWAVAISGNERSGAMGAGVVIGARRVLTCASVCAGLIDGNREPAGPLWVRFPKADVPGAQSRRVTGVQLPGGEHDLAVLLLEDAVPAGVRAARLRRPVPDDLDGLDWWAFGFPESQPHGNDAHGIVGAALGDGFVRLEAHSRHRVGTGFNGSGLWSPDYDAVVGLIGTAFTGASGDDRTADAQAITLYRADRCFGAEGLAGTGGWSAEQAGKLRCRRGGGCCEMTGNPACTGAPGPAVSAPTVRAATGSAVGGRR